ncbi:membrane-associated protein, putative [Bodo saltans]|uniref:Membrane-associated protein, putative n=1 Tax=Bodo saltans TaxID=75058 RepID=A0A0S4IT68_BODSA|nr:membrane-associated protein, putative [Bodo saltans]|eukprot:CUF66564.1 membrane-associated protein, putative [Bodo saltans]
MRVAVVLVLCLHSLALLAKAEEAAEEAAIVVDETSSDSAEADPLPPSLFVLSRHLQGRWSSTWTTACVRRQITQNYFFENETNQFLGWRDPNSNQKFDISLAGEGTSLPYLPFLQQIKRPRLKDVRVSYGYQLCTMAAESHNNLGEEKNLFGPVTEVRIARGFVFEVDENNVEAAFVLDRCVGGLNRNFNLFLTTVGAPIAASEEASVSPMTQQIRLVRWQYRLPGNVKCGEGEHEPPVVADDGIYDRAADDAFDVMVWTRTELPQSSFLEQHFSMIVFGGLFIVFRLFAGYRAQSQIMKNRKTLMAGVTEEVAANKSAFLKSLKEDEKKGGASKRR